MIHVTKKEQETTSAVVRRFMQRVQSSGILREAKSKKFFRKPYNRNMRRVSAIAREKKRGEHAKARKLGKSGY